MRTRNAGAGTTASSLSPSRKTCGSRTTVAHAAARAWSTMPAASIASTNCERAAVGGRNLAAVDRDQARSRCRCRHSAESRCSTVETRCSPMPSDGRAARVDDVIGMRRKLDRVVEPEAQTATRRRRQNANARGPAGVQTDARKFDRSAERGLILQDSCSPDGSSGARSNVRALRHVRRVSEGAGRTPVPASSRGGRAPASR